MGCDAFGLDRRGKNVMPDGWIDIHRHLSPPGYGAAVKAKYAQLPEPLAGWTPQRSIAEMDAAGIEYAMLSMPATPGIFVGDVGGAQRLARMANEYMAELRRAYPGRYGIFAALPLPDVAGTLQEIAFAFDVLEVEGIGLYTSYENRWLGDPSFAPVWEELNRRKALVFTHPNTPACCANTLPAINPAMIEYGTDTTRTIASLVLGGTTRRNPDVKIIFSHGGGTMPFLIQRFIDEAEDPRWAANLPDGVEAELRCFFYDTALISNRPALGALLNVVPVSQVLFGSDFPFRTAAVHQRGLAACDLLPAQLPAIARSNALRFLGRS
jgi:predicted TIM-barrel fold metal-dependent hydrolase